MVAWRWRDFRSVCTVVSDKEPLSGLVGDIESEFWGNVLVLSFVGSWPHTFSAFERVDRTVAVA